jgi:hypothetical protein
LEKKTRHGHDQVPFFLKNQKLGAALCGGFLDPAKHTALMVTQQTTATAGRQQQSAVIFSANGSAHLYDE